MRKEQYGQAAGSSREEKKALSHQYRPMCSSNFSQLER